MDWGTTFIFVLSIIGAVVLANGDVMVGIIAFLVCLCVLAAIKSIIGKLTTGEEPPTRRNSSANTETKIILNENCFVLVHNQVIKFLQAYASERPDEWYHYFISQEFEHIGGTTEGYLKFQVMLGSWWNGLLYNYPEVKDYMMSIFTFDASENTFTYKIRTGTCSGGSYPQDKIAKMVHKYLDNYESTHTCIHLTRESFGAKYSNV